MKLDTSKIRSGLYQMKQFLSRSKPQLKPQSISSASTFYKSIPANSERMRESGNFYIVNESSSSQQQLSAVRSAPSPSSLPSLRQSFADHRNSSQDDINLNSLLDDLDAAIEDGMNSPPSGPLNVQSDLKLYEDFLRLEAIRTPMPENNGMLKNLANGDYALERETDWHKSALLMMQLLEYYRIHYYSKGNPCTFSEFVTTVSADDLSKIWKVEGTQQTMEFVHRFKQGVRYLSAEKREKYNVTSHAGKLNWARWGNTEPLDTTVAKFYKRKHEPLHSFGNDSLAIWVLSREHKLYTHSAKVHRFHHSSFAAGDLIYCAGDWSVKDGDLQWISAASGHYRPTFDNFRYAIETLGTKFGLNANHYKVKVYEGSGRVKTEKLILAREFLFNFNHIKNNYMLTK